MNSLKNEFYTLNGRKVYDGGGIDPDISIKISEAPEILISLVSINFSKSLMLTFQDQMRDEPRESHHHPDPD